MMASDCSGDTCHEVAFGQDHERYGALLALLEEAQRGDYCVSCVAGFHLTQRDFQEQQTISFKQLGFCDFCSLQHFGFTRSIKMMDGPFSSKSLFAEQKGPFNNKFHPPKKCVASFFSGWPLGNDGMDPPKNQRLDPPYEGMRFDSVEARGSPVTTVVT